MKPTPPKMKETSLKRDHLKKEKSSNQHFSGDMLVSGPVRVKKHSKKEYGASQKNRKTAKDREYDLSWETCSFLSPKNKRP